MGAFERQTLPNPFGDYNRNTVVDAADYVLWRKTQGTNVSNYTAADGDGDGMVDSDDWLVWRANFGNALAPGAGSGAAVDVQTATLADSSAAGLTQDSRSSSIVVAAQDNATMLDLQQTGAAVAQSLHGAITSTWHSRTVFRRFLISLALRECGG